MRVDLDNPDTANNREVIAEIPVGWADNIAINADDRIFISSASDSAIVEVIPGGEPRVVVPGLFQLPLGVEVIEKTLYMSSFSGLVSFDRRRDELKSQFRAAFGVSAYPSTTSVVAWGKRLVVMSALDGRIMLWKPKTNTPVAEGQLFPPTDAQPFRGDLIVSQANGEIVRLSRDLAVIDVVANVPGATGLARKGGSVYVADGANGTVLQIIKRGEVLDTTPTVRT